MMSFYGVFIAVIFLGITSSAGAEQQFRTAECPTEEGLRVGVREAPAAVMVSREFPSGPEVDVFLKVLSRTTCRVAHYRTFSSSQSMVNALKNDQIDIAFGGLDPTSEREQDVLLSAPTLLVDNGKTALVRQIPSFHPSRFGGLIVTLLPIAAGFMLLPSLVWKGLERKRQAQDKPLQNWLDALWFGGISIITVGYGDEVSKAPLARLVLLPILLLGCPLYGGIVIAQVERALYGPQTNYEQIEDLRGVRVAVAPRSSSELVASQLEARVVRTGSLSLALELLQSGEVDAMMGDVREYKLLAEQYPELATVPWKVESAPPVMLLSPNLMEGGMTLAEFFNPIIRSVQRSPDGIQITNLR